MIEKLKYQIFVLCLSKTILSQKDSKLKVIITSDRPMKLKLIFLSTFKAIKTLPAPVSRSVRKALSLVELDIIPSRRAVEEIKFTS